MHRDAPSSSRESSSETRAKVVSGKHSIFTHLSKDRNCDICLRTIITRALCRNALVQSCQEQRIWVKKLTADHKVLSEGCESRHNHRHVVVVQDLATQWIQTYTCCSKTSQETEKSWQKFLAPTRNPRVIKTDHSLEFGKSCEDLS